MRRKTITIFLSRSPVWVEGGHLRLWWKQWTMQLRKNANFSFHQNKKIRFYTFRKHSGIKSAEKYENCRIGKKQFLKKKIWGKALRTTLHVTRGTFVEKLKKFCPNCEGTVFGHGARKLRQGFQNCTLSVHRNSSRHKKIENKLFGLERRNLSRVAKLFSTVPEDEFNSKHLIVFLDLEPKVSRNWARNVWKSARKILALM